MKLLLFDIDGTLLRSQGAGRETLAYALEQLFGTAGPIHDYPMNGKTDPRIVLDLLTAVGIPHEEITPQLPRVYELMAAKGHEIFPARDFYACPGVLELLAALQQRPDVVLGLLTGNAHLTAPLKLTAAGINPTLFKVGAYGSDALDRNELPAVGIARANQLTRGEFTGYNTIIIGDTPADILCARAGKATAVAVATGWHSLATLAKYQPDHLFENLVDTQVILDTLLLA
jgi:phosphoglycolate phosphatase-like HAD superfamily hydrolase